MQLLFGCRTVCVCVEGASRSRSKSRMSATEGALEEQILVRLLLCFAAAHRYTHTNLHRPPQVVCEFSRADTQARATVEQTAGFSSLVQLNFGQSESEQKRFVLEKASER